MDSTSFVVKIKEAVEVTVTIDVAWTEDEMRLTAQSGQLAFGGVQCYSLSKERTKILTFNGGIGGGMISNLLGSMQAELGCLYGCTVNNPWSRPTWSRILPIWVAGWPLTQCTGLGLLWA